MWEVHAYDAQHLFEGYIHTSETDARRCFLWLQTLSDTYLAELVSPRGILVDQFGPFEVVESEVLCA